MAKLAVNGGTPSAPDRFLDGRNTAKRSGKPCSSSFRAEAGEVPLPRTHMRGCSTKGWLPFRSSLRHRHSEWDHCARSRPASRGLRPGDEVIVPAYTWVGTASAVLFVEGIPVFVDSDPETYCMDPKALEAAITPRTRAVIPVHLGMQMADMDAILAISKQHNLLVIEDCAHAHGAQWKGLGAAAWDTSAPSACNPPNS